MNGITSIIGMLMSLFGMGTSTYTQIQTVKNMPKPPAQVQQCPPNSHPQIIQMSDGSYRIQCDSQ